MSSFRLAVVERLRSQALAERAQELHAVTSEIRAIADERNRMVAHLSKSPDFGTSASGAQMELAMAYREVLREQILAAGQRIAERQEMLGHARDAWLKARGDLRAVQALHEHYRAGVRREQARREQRELDDLAGRHGRVRTAADELDGAGVP
jgi:flagellar export protein FliJ